MSLQTTISNLMKMAENSLKWGQKILLEKEKLLVTSNFILPSVFKRLKSQTNENQGLFGKGLSVLLKLIV